MKKIIGIDLAAEKGKTGFCILNRKVRTCILKTDEAIIKEIKDHRPKVIAIDAPLSLPKDGKTRKAEKDLRKIGIRTYPPLLPSMIKLTQRGMRLKKKLKEYKVIEIYPGAAYDRFGIPRKNNEKALRRVFKKYNITLERRRYSQHELDAITAAVIGKLYLQNRAEAFGSKKEGQIIIPQ